MAKKKTIGFHGNAILTNDFFDPTTPTFLETETVATFEILSTRSEADEKIVEIDDEDLLELEFEDGLVRFMTLEQLREEFPDKQVRGSEPEEEIFQLPRYLEGYEPATRGLVKNLLKRVSVFSVTEKVADLSVLALAQKIESRLEPGEGLYHCQNPNRLGERATITETTEPILILLHGTASSTSGSFGGLVENGTQTPAWKSILELYEDRIYAFEHRTLSKSPLQNTLDLLEVLPENAKVHLISHSRGGLVGEILSRNMMDADQAFSKLEIEVFEKEDRNTDVRLLQEINVLLKKKKIKVERFVRVACPAGGTLLASKRLDTYLTVLLNLIGMIPALKATPLYGYVKSFLIAFVKKKADVELVPGLEAMMPGSPVIKVLNNPANRIKAELFVIAGDVKAHGLLRSLAVILTDAFYREQHDYVVNTLSMFGSARRAETYYAFYSNKEVSHFKYFTNRASQDDIVAALSVKEGVPAGFKALSQLQLQEFKKSGVRGRLHYVAPGEKKEKDAPFVYVIPGIMGSKLSADEDLIWVHLLNLAIGQMKRLKIGASDVKAVALMGSAYRSLVIELGKRYNVVPFPFDWRLSIIDSAARLAEDIEKRLKNTEQPIQIMAHSMGGLVVRALYSAYPKIWEAFSARQGARVIFLGSPLGGSHVIPALFLKRHKIFNNLHSLDLAHSSTELLQIINKYPGLLQLLPMEDEFYGQELWEKIQAKEKDFAIPHPDDLDEARKLKVLFESKPLEGDHLIYVAGKDAYTPYELDCDSQDKVLLYGTSRGDSCVTWDTGIPKQLKDRTWYMRATHGALCATKEYFPALIELLETGFTRLLPNQPIMMRGEEERFLMPEEYPIVMNSTTAFEDGIMGLVPRLGDVGSDTKVEIEVCHGDLGNAGNPVMVGHHVGDHIVSAEKVVDFYMKGRLSQYHDVGKYPGKIETSLVLFARDSKFKGAVVVGLGVYGELNEEGLTRSFRHALIDYAMACMDKDEETHTGKEKEVQKRLGISSLLIASDYSGLTIRNSLRAALTGVLDANKSLANMGGVTQPPIIEKVEIIEIYKDRAIHATRELKKIIDEPNFKDRVVLSSGLIRETSGRRERIPGDRLVEWWHRLKVESDSNNEREKVIKTLSDQLKEWIDDESSDAENKKTLELLEKLATLPLSEGYGPLKFVSLTDRARAEEQIKSTQRLLIDELIASSVKSPDWNAETARTLFHLLIPNSFKDYATDTKNILLIVDEESSQYPWEILHYPTETSNQPLSTRIGLIRQLVTPVYDEGINPTLENRALVIGNPKMEKSSKYPDLPHAKEEAEEVRKLFGAESYDLVASIEEGSVSTMNKLFGHNYKIIHLAGHGIVHPKDPSKTGMVLDKGMFITAAEIESLPQTPEFVFINCCYLGESVAPGSGSDFNKLAANVGTQFIRKGVKAVVAAGWAIDDELALHFARVLYGELFNGANFGEAVRQARSRTYEKNPSSNTWGAYQCYGDPYYRLVRDSKSHGNDNYVFVDKAEALVEFRNIASQTEAASSRKEKELKAKLGAIIAAIPSFWMEDSVLVEAIASCYYELNQYREAEYYFKKLSTLADGLSTTEASRKYANIQMKLILQDIERGIGNPGEHKARMNLAEGIIESLLGLGRTFTRLSVKGGHYKRRSLITAEKAGILQCLTTAADAYREAHYVLPTIDRNYYTLLNWLTLEQICWFYGERNRKKLRDEAQAQFTRLKAQLKDYLANDKTFWAQTYVGATGIYELLETEKVKEQTPIIRRVVENYEQNWDKGGSIRKSENILGQLTFSIGILSKLLELKNQGHRVPNVRKLKYILRAYQNLDNQLRIVFEN